MYFCALNDNTVKKYDKTKYISIENFSENYMNKFRKEITDAEINSKLDPSLNADPNSNYEILSKYWVMPNQNTYREDRKNSTTEKIKLKHG